MAADVNRVTLTGTVGADPDTEARVFMLRTDEVWHAVHYPPEVKDVTPGTRVVVSGKLAYRALPTPACHVPGALVEAEAVAVLRRAPALDVSLLGAGRGVTVSVTD